MRFAIREARLSDAEGIALAHTASWRDSYRGILPPDVLERIDVGQRVQSRRAILADGTGLHLVAYDVTHDDIVGFCDAGPSRRAGADGELYAIYLLPRVKRFGLGTEMFARVRAGLAAARMASMMVWVLEDNHHARRFYEAMGGALGNTLRTSVAGFPVIERAYHWSRLAP